MQAILSAKQFNWHVVCVWAVLSFFAAPNEDECKSEDGLRSGVCMNIYECHQKGGTAKGECFGFGACCVCKFSNICRVFCVINKIHEHNRLIWLIEIFPFFSLSFSSQTRTLTQLSRHVIKKSKTTLHTSYHHNFQLLCQHTWKPVNSRLNPFHRISTNCDSILCISQL